MRKIGVALLSGTVLGLLHMVGCPILANADRVESCLYVFPCLAEKHTLTPRHCFR